MLQCPICDQPGISTWKKIFIGPGRTIVCSNCGNKVSIPYSSLLYALPAFAALAYFASVGEDGIIIAASLFVAAFIFNIIAQIKFVPLIYKEKLPQLKHPGGIKPLTSEEPPSAPSFRKSK